KALARNALPKAIVDKVERQYYHVPGQRCKARMVSSPLGIPDSFVTLPNGYITPSEEAMKTALVCCSLHPVC
ncbi:unnamed protein product, partial [Polarella glacialis]